MVRQGDLDKEDGCVPRLISLEKPTQELIRVAII